MRIALLGTRGVPARYGGFETAVEEIGRRLVERGHTVTVYCRGRKEGETYLGMQLVHLPTIRVRSAETLVHTAASSLHVLIRSCADVAVVFNAANAPLVPFLHAASVPVAIHVDGLEWKRGKWGRVGRIYYLAAERMAVATGDALIVDSRAIGAYYGRRYGVPSTYLPYGAPLLEAPGSGRIEALGLEPGGYHLVVARLEPENQVGLAIEGYRASGAKRPLVVVGGNNYGSDHVDHLHALASRYPGVRMLGPVWDQEFLNELYANAATYVHGHSVGGTNPSLLRAAAMGVPILAADVEFNREVLGPCGRYFASCDELAALLALAEENWAVMAAMGRDVRARITKRYRWDDVAAGYETLCDRLVQGPPRARRRPAVTP